MDFISILSDPEGGFFGFIQIVNWIYHSWFMFGVKVFFAVYVYVLIADIVLLLVLRGVSGDIRTGLRGMDIPLTTPSGMDKKWLKIKNRLNTNNESQYKVAVLEADALADKILSGIGYQGENMTERLAQIKPSQLDNLEDLIAAHQIRNRIIHDENFALDRKTAEEVISLYENFLRYLEFL